MDYDDAALGVGFAIDPEGSFESLRQIEAAMNTTEAKIVADAAKIERATGGMINVAGATVQMTSLGNEMTKTSFRAAADAARIEKAGERMVRQLERQAETFGKSASEIRDMRVEMRAVEADSRGLTELASRLRAASAQINQLEQGTKRLPGPSNAARAATQNLGFQVQDFAVQIIGGTDALRAFAMQAPQAAGAMTGFEGKLGSVGKFLNGPWGIAITLGITLLAGFADKLGMAGNAIDETVDKLKDQARQSDITRQAQERFKDSAEGVAAAIRDGTEATKGSLEALRSSAEQANINARRNYELALSKRQLIRDELEHAKILAENAKGSWIGANGPNGAQSIVANQYAAEVDRINKLLAEQNGLIAQAQARINVTNIDIAAEAASLSVDPIKRINAAYDDQVNALKRLAVERAQNGQAVDANIAGLSSEFTRIERNRAAALKAEEDRQAALKQTNNEIGRTITLLEARAIAEKAGGRVTSDQRSHAQQQALYDKYMAYKSGTGPWAALAAKPGTSNHELGQALDVAKSDGMTLAKLVKAYRAAGVKLTEALDEGSHFHIAWAAGKAVTEAAKEADKVAKWLEEQRLKAQGNVWQLAQDIGKRNAEFGKDVPTLGSRMLQEEQDAADLLRAQQELRREVMSAFMDDLDRVSDRVDVVAANMRDAFGSVGGAIGGLITVLDEYGKRQAEIDKQRELGGLSAKEQASLRQQESDNQIAGMVALTGAAKGLFSEHSKGYKAMEAAEKALTVIQLARTAVDVAGGAARMFATLGPYAFPAVAAMLGVMASLGFGGGGSAGSLPKSNDGTGTVLGDASAKSESIKRAIDSLKEVDTVMLTYSRQMAASLSAIESNISGFAALVLRTENVNASAGVNTGFSQDTTGKVLEGIITGGGLFSKIPVVGGIIGGIGSIIGSLFGSKTKVVGSGLYGGAQSLEDILSGGFDASYYSDIQKKKKLFGLTTSTKYSTQYSDADSGLENQFTLILREFNNAILAAAGPLGVATSEIQQKLNGFVVNIGKIDLQGLTGDEIEEKLTAVFGAAADKMAQAAFPGIEKFQAVGEGLFDTLVRVASTVESVTSSLTMLGSSASGMSIDLKMALADQFDSVSDFSSAVDSYFETYYTKEEQAAARTAQFATVFDSLDLAMPGTLAAFRQLVDAQDLTTTAGQATYATLLQLAPAFADLQSALNGAKSAADILSERQDLEKQLLELQGNTAAIREMELANLDESNRALQQQIWALQDAQEAADAAQKLKDAWSSVGDSIMDEVNRIRGITDGTGTGSFAQLQGQFNAAVAAAKGGDQDAAGTLPSLSQALIQAAELAATSRQELDRVKAQTAASLESVYASVLALAGGTSATGVATGTGAPTGTILEAAATAAQASASTSDSDSVVTELKALRAEVAQMRSENNSGHAATASNTGSIKKTMDNVTADSGGDAITVAGTRAA